MKKSIFLLNLLIGCFIFLCVNAAAANPPSRVARLSYFNGQVSFWPASLKKWVLPTINRPLIASDRLWSDSNGKVELQLGGAAVRLGAKTSVSILKLNDHIAQFKLDQGTLNLKIKNIKSTQAYEIDTSNIAFYLRNPGDYRIDVDRFSTTVSVRSGKGKAYGVWAVYATVNAQQSCRFTGVNLRNYQCFPLGLPDSFDRWCLERENRPRANISIRYVSPEVIGYEDLDTYGTWRVVSGYGNVWMPNRVTPGWAPYRFGHWVWIEPWGWTWIDNEPWGFAPFHYGRWVNANRIWYWVPGRMKAKPVYSPALVAFVGNSHLRSQSGVSLVAWFPLGPEEVYRPAYKVSRDYFVEINRSNTTLNNTYISNQYNNVVTTKVVYVNQSVPNAISVVPAPVFTQAKPVSQAVVSVPQQSLAKESVKTAPTVVPTQESIVGNKVAPPVTPPPVVEQKPAENLKQPIQSKHAEKEAEKPVVTSPESHAVEKKVEALEKSVVENKPVEPPKEPIEKPVEKSMEKPSLENKPPLEVSPIEKPATENKSKPEIKPLVEKSAEIEKSPEKPTEVEKVPEKQKSVEPPAVQAPPLPPPEEKAKPIEKPEKQPEEIGGNQPLASEAGPQKPKELKEPQEEKKEEPLNAGAEKPAV